MAEDQAAVADEEFDPAEGQADEPEKKGGLLKWIIILLIVLAGGGAAAWYFLFSHDDTAVDGETSAAVSSGKPNYLEFDPGFVVNLDDPDLMRYLQVDIQLMSRKSGVLADVEEYMPEIRNRLLLLLAQQKFETLVPREGKEKLQTEALKEVNAVLRENGIKDSVDELYFTSFVMQ